MVRCSTVLSGQEKMLKHCLCLSVFVLPCIKLEGFDEHFTILAPVVAIDHHLDLIKYRSVMSGVLLEYAQLLEGSKPASFKMTFAVHRPVAVHMPELHVSILQYRIEVNISISTG